MLESGVDAALERAERRRESSAIDALTAFWLATAGGGIALDLPVGRFDVGYQFDAMLIDASMPGSNLQLDSADHPDAILQKVVYGATRSNIREVWVAGRSVSAAS